MFASHVLISRCHVHMLAHNESGGITFMRGNQDGRPTIRENTCSQSCVPSAGVSINPLWR